MTKRRRGNMDQSVFTLAAQRLGITGRDKSYNAAREVLCEGSSVLSASRLHRAPRSYVYVAIQNIESTYKQLGLCPYCGTRMREV